MQTNTLLGLLVVLCVVAGGVYYIASPSGMIGGEAEMQTVVAEKNIEFKTDFYSISATYPVEPLDTENTIEQFVIANIDDAKEQWKEGGEVYNSEQQIAKDFPDRPKMEYTRDIVSFSTGSKKLAMVSHVLTVGEYTGGAHGNAYDATFTFDKNGPIAIESILNFENDNDIALSHIVQKKLQESLGEMRNDDMIDTGLGLAYLKEDGKTLDQEKCQCDGFFFGSNFQNFMVSDEGLTFIMGEYQVAPYASGMPEVFLTWEELRPFIQEGFALPLE